MTVTLKKGDAAKLDHIPGLRVALDGASAAGSLDAESVALKRIGRSDPTQGKCISRKFSIPLEHLREYQRNGVLQITYMLETHGGAILADDMGLGKTLQAITVAKHFGGRVFVVCPASVRETWRDEMLKWWPSSTVAVLGPRSTKRYAKEWSKASAAHVVVAGYQGTAEAHEAAFPYDQAETLIIDEGQLVAGRKTKRSKEVEQVSMFCRYKLLLSGTPAWNKPRDFYKLLNILFRNRFGKGWEFDLAYCGGRLGDYGVVGNDGATRSDELKARLAHFMVRREKSEVLKELPPFTRQVIWVDPTSDATAAFQSNVVGQGGGSHFHDALRACDEGKIDTAVELAVTAKRFLLFTYRKAHVEKLVHGIVERGGVAVGITGNDSAASRTAKIASAIAQGGGVVATIDSLSTGVDALKHVAYVGIMHALPLVDTVALQAEARLHRLGQINAVHWLWLAMRESMDEVVMRILIKKLDQKRALLPASGGERKLRDTLEDSKAGGQEAEASMLKAIYQSMEEGGDYDE